MRASAFRERVADGQRELAVEVAFASRPAGSVPLFFGWSDGGPLAAPGDPLLAALLVPAMALHEDLRIDAPVSEGLLAAARDRIAPVMLRLFPDFRAIEIEPAEVVRAGAAPPDTVATFFSGGLDSNYALARNRERVTHLVFVHGFDLELADEAMRADVSEKVRKVARAGGLEVLEVVTNLRYELLPQVRRRLARAGRPRHRFVVQCQLGSMLVSFGQLLAPSVGRVLVPASWAESYETPTGSNASIEPNWSTPGLAFELAGAELGRVEKLQWLARAHPEVLRELRVCLASPRRPGNCGRCRKCSRLRLELRVAGIEPGRGPFPDQPDFTAIRRQWIPMEGYFWPEILRHARARGDQEVAETVEVLMGRRFHLPRAAARLRMFATPAGRRKLRRLARESQA